MYRPHQQDSNLVLAPSAEMSLASQHLVLDASHRYPAPLATSSLQNPHPKYENTRLGIPQLLNHLCAELS